MVDVEIQNLLSNKDEAFNEIKNRFLTIDRLVIDIAGDNFLKTSLWSYSRQRLKGSLNINMDYAIGLLKKTDQDTNVYEHLRNILDKLSLERPKNPLGLFERYSFMVKRTYIYRDVNFEHVFVDHISQIFCLRSLQMYKFASNKESETQKKSLAPKGNKTRNTTGRNSNSSTGGDVIASVQNLWEVNYLFNKAGCGLPIDEVSLLSLSMNTMAELNKFKSIRFWGKVFGLKRTYYVIECEWTDVEIQRKLSMESRSKLAAAAKIAAEKAAEKTAAKVVTKAAEARVQTVPNKEYKLEEPTLSKLIESTDDDNDDNDDFETESVGQMFESVARTAAAAAATVTALDNATVNDEYSSSDFPSDDDDDDDDASYAPVSADTLSEAPSADTYGIGVNRNVYFVTNDLNVKWIELDSVSPRTIAEARDVKRYFTGKLYDPVGVNASVTKFDGLEITYLRAQIARISASTHVCPQGFYTINKKNITPDKITDFQSTDLDMPGAKYNFEFIPNKNVDHITNTNLIDCKYWAHKNPRIENNGVTNYSDLSVQLSSTSYHDDFRNTEFEEEGYEYDNTNILHVEEELFGNLIHDVTHDGTPAWTGALCSPFERHYGCYITMKSNIWPGAYAVTYKDKTDFVYIGWAQKQDFSGLYAIRALNLLNELQTENVNKNDFVEYQDLKEDQRLNKQRKPNKKKRT